MISFERWKHIKCHYRKKYYITTKKTKAYYYLSKSNKSSVHSWSYLLEQIKKKKKFLKEPYKNFLFCNIRRAFRIQLSKFRHNNTLITGTKIHLRSHVDSFSILVWTVHAPKSVNTRECIPYFVCQIIDEISNFTEISTVYGPLEIRYVTNSP